MAGTYRFSFGPWNIHEGADPFGPTVRQSVAFNEKLGFYRELGFVGVQLHDDDARTRVPDRPAPRDRAIRHQADRTDQGKRTPLVRHRRSTGSRQAGAASG